MSPDDEDQAYLDNERLIQIFQPSAANKLRQLREGKLRFAYYTTAEGADGILATSTIWMRNAQTMNDAREVMHGFECLARAFTTDAGMTLWRSIDELHADVSTDVMNNLEVWRPGMHYGTFLACVSEHTAKDDDHGRLSMWRAYGGRAGVALVINLQKVMESNGAILGVQASPVMYALGNSFEEHFYRLANNVRSNRQSLLGLGRERLANAAFDALRILALCAKHPGFEEEQEWRVVASPDLYETKIGDREIAVVRGVPQAVVKLQLRDRPDLGLSGMSLSDLIERVIVGPCEFPHVVADALYQRLRAAGIPDAGKKIRLSEIPLRHM